MMTTAEYMRKVEQELYNQVPAENEILAVEAIILEAIEQGFYNVPFSNLHPSLKRELAEVGYQVATLKDEIIVSWPNVKVPELAPEPIPSRPLIRK